MADGPDDPDDPFRPGRRYRRGDPTTSRDAAIQSERAVRVVVDLVEQVMLDGTPRTDEGIWRACQALDFVGSLDTVQHARGALERIAVLVLTGYKSKISTGGMAREWVLRAVDYCPRCRHVSSRIPGTPGVYAILVCPLCGVVARQLVFGQEFINETLLVDNVITQAWKIASS